MSSTFSVSSSPSNPLPIPSTAVEKSKQPSLKLDRLYKDAILSMFSFLNYHDAARAGRLNHRFWELVPAYRTETNYLDLSKNTRDSRWAEEMGDQGLCRAVDTYPNIRSLKLSGSFSDEGLAQAFTRWPNITHLDLSGCSGFNEIPSLGTYFQGKKNVQLTLAFCGQLKAENYTQLFSSLDFPSLQKLNVLIDILSGNLSTENLAQLSGLLPSCAHLEELHVSTLGGSLRDIRETLHGCFANLPPSIQHLDLSQFEFTDTLVDILLPRVRSMSLRTVYILTSSEATSLTNGKLEALLKQISFEKMERISLKGLEISTAVVKQLTLSLRNAKKIEGVSVRHFGADVEETALIALIDEVPSTYLRRLDIQRLSKSTFEESAEIQSAMINKTISSPCLEKVKWGSGNFHNRLDILHLLSNRDYYAPEAVIRDEVRLNELLKERARCNELLGLWEPNWHFTQTLSHLRFKANEHKDKDVSSDLQLTQDEFIDFKRNVENRLDEICAVVPVTGIEIAKTLETIETEISELRSTLNAAENA